MRASISQECKKVSPSRKPSNAPYPDKGQSRSNLHIHYSVHSLPVISSSGPTRRVAPAALALRILSMIRSALPSKSRAHWLRELAIGQLIGGIKVDGISDCVPCCKGDEVAHCESSRYQQYSYSNNKALSVLFTAILNPSRGIPAPRVKIIQVDTLKNSLDCITRQTLTCYYPDSCKFHPSTLSCFFSAS